MTRPNTSLIALLAGVALAAPAIAGADSRYAGVAAGLWLPDAGGNVKSELDNGIAGELRLGWRVHDNFALEGAIGALQADATLPPADVTEPTLHSVSSTYALLSGWAFLPLGEGAWRLGAGAGLGYYSADLKAKTPPANEERASETDTGFHFGAAVRYAVTEKYGLGLEYRVVSVSPGNVDIDGAAAMLAGDYHF